jgi:hypothetical protein
MTRNEAIDELNGSTFVDRTVFPHRCRHCLRPLIPGNGVTHRVDCDLVQALRLPPAIPPAMAEIAAMEER